MTDLSPQTPEAEIRQLRARIEDLERINAQQVLNPDDLRQQEILQTIFDHIPVMIVLLDRTGRMRFTNRHWQQVTGWTAEEARARDMLAEFYPDPEYRRYVLDYILHPPQGWGEFQTRVKDGRVIDTAWANVLLSDGTSIGLGLDITERKRLEDQFRQAQKMEAIGRLAGGVAHDFNNLLTIILGYSEILLRKLDADSADYRAAREIKSAGDRAASLTQQLLAFGRRQVLAPAVLDLNTVILDLDKMLRRLIGEDIDLVAALAPDLGRVRADRSQLEQALVNLAVNARDAMAHGGKLTIRTRNVAAGGAGPLVIVEVSDTGVGMDPATQAHIFEPFFTTKALGKGTGLGLPMVYGFVTQSGGHMEVDSATGQGSTFRIYLPRVDAPVQATTGSQQGLGPVQRGTETVLVVEDEAEVRALIKLALRGHGYTVLDNPDGHQALLRARQHEGAIHLLVTDVVMPQMSGRQLADQFLTLRPQAKVLFVSGHSEHAISRLGMLDPAVNFLQKPFTPTVLARRVREVLDGTAIS